MKSANPFIQTERRIQALDRRIIKIERRRRETDKKLETTRHHLKMCFIGTAGSILLTLCFYGLR